MRVIIVGLGVQGQKRKKVAGSDCVATVDPVCKDADYRALSDVPLGDYDAALCCTPDEPKVELLSYLLANGKHVLVEKPLWAADEEQIAKLEAEAHDKSVFCYAAYNHRFEPHYVRMRDLIASGELGAIYRCRMFYGNGTARLVRDSAWRDNGSGVVHDLGSHLLDTACFWFGPLKQEFEILSSNCFETKAPDHAIIGTRNGLPNLELEMTLLSWRNHFTCDVFAENGSAHIESLCKWGPSRFIQRTRVLPSGKPPEEALVLQQDDPTWALEYAYFKQRCISSSSTSLANDIWLNRLLRQLGEEAVRRAAP